MTVLGSLYLHFFPKLSSQCFLSCSPSFDLLRKGSDPWPPTALTLSKLMEKDKVCEICGDAGFTEGIVTCCKCKKVSQHIYCMPEQLPSDWEYWHCEDCLLVPYTNRKIVESSSSNVNKLRNLVKRSSQHNYDGYFEQSCNREIEFAESQKPLHTQGCSSEMHDVGRRCPVIDSASDILIKRSLSCRSIKTVGNGKVKFIPSEELLAPRTKARISHIRESSGVLFTRIKQENTMHAPLSQRTSSSISLSSSSKMILDQQNKGATNIKAHLSSSSMRENAVYDKGKKVSGLFCKELEVDLDANNSSEHVILTEAKCLSIPQKLPDDKLRKRVTEKALEKENCTKLIKEEPAEGCSDAVVLDFPLNKIESRKSQCVSTFLPFNAMEREDVLPYCLPDTGFRAMESEAYLNRLPSCGSGNFLHGDALKISGFQRKELPFPQLIVYDDEHPHFPVIEPVWKGEFDIGGVLSHVYHGIQAHIPGKVHVEANKMLKQVPVRIRSKALYRLDVWPKKFRLDPPAFGDIGLFFFPCHYRYKENFVGLVERIDKNDLAMQSWMDDVELLIFSSKQLSEDYQVTGLPVSKFLWGVFRRRKCKKRSLPRQGGTPSEVHVPSISTCATKVSVERNSKVKMESMEIDTSQQNLLENNSDYIVAGGGVAMMANPIIGVDIPPGFENQVFKYSL